MNIQLPSPYHPTLALNGGGFPEGFSCHHLNPIRYIVRGASHQPHSAWQARPRRVRQEHAGYYNYYLSTLNYATSCRTRTKSWVGAVRMMRTKEFYAQPQFSRAPLKRNV